MYLVNPSGAIVGVSDEHGLELLQQEGFRRLNAIESLEIDDAGGEAVGLPIHLIAHMDEADGYGQSQMPLANALRENGINPVKRYNGQKVSFTYSVPPTIRVSKSEQKIIYTMFESTQIPDEWVYYLEQADKIITPSKFVQDAFASKGFESTVVPLGYNSDLFEYIERPERDVFTFLHYDAFNTRKGWDIVFKAFTEEFGGDMNVRLVLKTVRSNIPFPIMKDKYPNIEVIKRRFSSDEMQKMLFDADAFIFPSRGEGFGITPLEALATGLDVAIPNGSGMSEYFNKDIFKEIEIEGMRPAIYQHFKNGVGEMIEPSVESTKRVMRDMYENKDKYRAEARTRAEWAKENYTIRSTGAKLAEIIKNTDTTQPYKKTNKPRVAVIMKNISHYSGGRYHNWLQALQLNEKYDVVVYTDVLPVFAGDFDLHDVLKIEDVESFNKLDFEADIYFGSPIEGVEVAMRLGAKYHKPVITVMFDPPTWMEQSDVVEHREMQRHYDFKSYYDEYRKDIAGFKLLVNTENSIDDYAQWHGIPKDEILDCNPPLNSRLINLFAKNKERRKEIIAVSRNSPRKAWSELLEAFKPYSGEYILHVITNSPKGLLRACSAIGVDTNSVQFHSSISDLEKFALYARSCALLSASHFEGFGMWATEALSMGIPVACYDLPSLDWLNEGMYKAPMGDVNMLSKRLGEAIKGGTVEPIHSHDIDGLLKDRLYGVVDTLLEAEEIPVVDGDVSVLMIALNEEEYIGASLQAVLKRPEVRQVIVIEGADRKYPRANKKGLSVDGTAKMVRKLQRKYPDKLYYERVGWVDDKTELRQRCIDLAEKSGWGLFVDADEVWSDWEWDRLMSEIRKTPNVGTIYFKHYHFWKGLDRIAVGGQWDGALFRLFRLDVPNLQLGFHAGEPEVDGKGRIGDVYGRRRVPVYVHHYGYAKSEQNVKDKIDYYAKRDAKTLDVKDTFTGKQEVEGVNPTHGTGSAIDFNGEHPVEICELKQ